MAVSTVGNVFLDSLDPWTLSLVSSFFRFLRWTRETHAILAYKPRKDRSGIDLLPLPGLRLRV